MSQPASGDDRKAVRIDARHFAVLDTPNKRAPNAAGLLVKTHDDLGLPLDPAVYAKTSCTTCHGKGELTVRRLMTMAEAYERHGRAARANIERVLAAKSGEGTVSTDEVDRKLDAAMKLIVRGGAMVVSNTHCACAEKRYHQARNTVAQHVKSNG